MSFPTAPSDGAGYPPATYPGNSGEATAWLRRAEQEPELRTGSGFASYLATGADTAGRFGLYRWDMEPRAGGPAPHFHRTMSESFFVIEGTVNLFDGKEWSDTRPGDFCFVPEGGVHGFRNQADQAASMLILFSPGAPREAYFEGLIEMFSSGREVSPEEFTAFCERHDNYYL